MNLPLSSIRALGVVSLGLCLSACGNLKVTHVTPHTSLKVALAKKAELVRMPQQTVAPGDVNVPAVEPALPDNGKLDLTAAAYTNAEFLLSNGTDAEATAALEEVVKLDPNFTEAWLHLAALYEKQGDKKKALEAFRRAKKIARQ